MNENLQFFTRIRIRTIFYQIRKIVRILFGSGTLQDNYPNSKLIPDFNIRKWIHPKSQSGHQTAPPPWKNPAHAPGHVIMQPVVVLPDMVQSVVGGGQPWFFHNKKTGTRQITKIPQINPDINGSIRRAWENTSLGPPPWKNPVHAPDERLDLYNVKLASQSFHDHSI